jgi:RNA polymerase sigma-70 factor (ECF subfamily)
MYTRAPEELCCSCEIAEDSSQLLQVLTPTQRRVVHLRFIEDLSIAQIAARTAQSDGAVKMVLHRAIQRLRRHWSEGAV